MIKPIYLDLHIHTSENADNLNQNYDINKLIEKVSEKSNQSDFLISLTDHNVINKKIYNELLEIENKLLHLVLGVELHIRVYAEKEPYHAHIFFNVDNIADSIDDINNKLNLLYPTKMVSKDSDIPSLEEIIRIFEGRDFIILPHGGQSHHTFDKAIPRDVSFDSTMERMIYYNQFDGFTARNNEGLEDTIDYFKKLNINEFINLVTGTDNYNANNYPNPKSEEASNFIPTWMLAEPTFDGLRLSLSEGSRLVYSEQKPDIQEQIIKGCKLQNEKIDIDVKFTSGLNVVIGESSSGKSLLIDTIYRKINDDFEETVYKDFLVSDIYVDNPVGFHPHYINQNFLVEKINNKKISEIEIIKSLFPSNDELKSEINNKLINLQSIINNMINACEKLEQYQTKIRAIPVLSSLIYEGSVSKNPIEILLPNDDIIEQIKFEKSDFNKYIQILDELKMLPTSKVFIKNMDNEIETIKSNLKLAYDKYKISESVLQKLNCAKEICSSEKIESDGEKVRKEESKQNLLKFIKQYSANLKIFNENLEELVTYNYSIQTQEKDCGGHKLSIINEFKINADIITDAIKPNLKSDVRSFNLNDLKPTILFQSNFSSRPKVENYSDLSSKIYERIKKTNEEKYTIITKDNKIFDKLSPGWKTAIILDLIFNSKNDNAPLLIDQPEDNLTSTYMNGDMIKAIHNSKRKRQIIAVSHNATIPMLGDAQNIIVCKVTDEKLVIRNAPLESCIDNIKVIDSVARLTDGGKTSIKKRFKKYNLKKYRGDEDENSN